jgi:AcrR family transcriptional regulator
MESSISRVDCLVVRPDSSAVKRTGALRVPAPEVREVAWAAGPRTDKTKQLIVRTANRLFLERGYSVVRVEDIVSAAQISRSLFYVYFPSKRDVFLAIGVDSIAAGGEVLDAFASIPREHAEGDVALWIDRYVAYLEQYGAFLRSWEEFVSTDDHLQRASHANVERYCRRLGVELERLRGHELGDPTVEGLALRSLIEGVWYFWRVSDLPRERHQIVAMLATLVETHIKSDPRPPTAHPATT